MSYTTDSCYEANARLLLNDLGLKKIQNLIDNETKTMIFKALNGLAAEYLSDLFIRNSDSLLRPPRNISTYLATTD